MYMALLLVATVTSWANAEGDSKNDSEKKKKKKKQMVQQVLRTMM